MQISHLVHSNRKTLQIRGKRLNFVEKMASDSEKCKYDEAEEVNEKIAAIELPPADEIVMSSTTISDLNDDCLREICKYFSLSNLCVFADVCHRFKQIAQSHFQPLKLVAITKQEWEDLPRRNLYRLIRNFGESINSLLASSSKRSRNEQYC